MSSYTYRSKPGGIGSRSRRPQRTNTNRGRGQYIDPARFVKAAKPTIEVVEYVPTNQFMDFQVHPELKANLSAKDYVTPTPIQDQTIPLALEGKDVIGIANTGTGKTAAFAVPLIHRMASDPHAKALIIAPVRELAQQIEEECKSIAKGSGLRGALLIGGAPMHKQLQDLKARPSIVIGTPGRIKDHIEQGSLDLSKFNLVVLDEVDRMLDMGFIKDVSFILGRLAPQRQSLFFSATLDYKVGELIRTFSNEPVTVSVKYGETNDNVEQDVVPYVSKEDKLSKLHDILLRQEAAKVIIFHDKQYSVERLGKELVARGFSADSIHGGKSQGQRMRALKRFKDNEVNILVATDVAARGIDVVDITHVINYTTPTSYEDYVHRIGRAGRAGRSGYALTFVEQTPSYHS